MKRLYRNTIITALLIAPSFALAQTVTLTNPLGTTDVRLITANIIQGALSLSGVVALLMFLYGGIIWLTSTGKPDRIEQGKKVLVWATLGIVVIASSYIITLAIFRAILTGSVAP